MADTSRVNLSGQTSCAWQDSATSLSTTTRLAYLDGNGTLDLAQSMASQGWQVHLVGNWTSNDTDSDGSPDLVDDCTTGGTSVFDQQGCPDVDADGWSDPDGAWTTSDGADALPQEPTQWSDSDGDGSGENWADSTWNEIRKEGWPGIHRPDAVNADRCPTIAGDGLDSDRPGCPEVGPGCARTGNRARCGPSPMPSRRQPEQPAPWPMAARRSPAAA